MQLKKIRFIFPILFALAFNFTLPDVRAGSGDPGNSQNSTTQNSSAQNTYTAEFLNQFPVIKVGFTPAPGNGHQASTMLVMKNLRELGYQGKFEIYYDLSDKDLGSKLEKFLPGFTFDHNNLSRQSLPAMNATIEPFAKEYKTHASTSTNNGSIEAFSGASMKGKTLAVCGGDDKYLNPDQIGADYVIRFGATNFGNPEIRVAYGPPEDRKYRAFAISEAQNMGIGNPAPKPKDAQEFIKKQFEGFPEEKSAKVQGLLAMEKVMKQHEVLTAYGLSYQDGWVKLATLLKATMKVQENEQLNLKKGVVVPLLSNFNDQEWAVFNSHLDEAQKTHIKVISASDPEITSKLKNIGPKDIVIVKVGAVPQGVWDHLIAESTYPPIIAGTTSHEYANGLGKPFINAVGISNLSSPTLIEHFGTISSALKKGDVSAVEKQLTAARTPDSPLQKEFRSNVEDRQKNPERVQYVVSRLIDFDEQSKVGPGIRKKFLNGQELTDVEQTFLEQPAQSNLRWTIALDVAKNKNTSIQEKIRVIDEVAPYDQKAAYLRYESLVRHAIENTPKTDGDAAEIVKWASRVRFENLNMGMSAQSSARVIEALGNTSFNTLSIYDWTKSGLVEYLPPEKAKQFIEEAVRLGNFYYVANTQFKFVEPSVIDQYFLSAIQEHPERLGSLFYTKNDALEKLKKILESAPASERAKILSEYQAKATKYDNKRVEVESFLKEAHTGSDPVIDCIDNIAI